MPQKCYTPTENLVRCYEKKESKFRAKGDDSRLLKQVIDASKHAQPSTGQDISAFLKTITHKNAKYSIHIWTCNTGAVQSEMKSLVAITLP